MITNKRATLLIGVMLGLVFLAQTPDTWTILSQLKARQVQANDRFYDWRNAYEALQPVNEKWRVAYPPNVKDLVELYQKINLEKHGLKADVDAVRQTEVATVYVKGFNVGLQSLCIGTNGQKVRLTSPTASGLRQGLESLAARKDIELGSLEFGFDRDENIPIIDVTGLCLRVRAEVQNEA